MNRNPVGHILVGTSGFSYKDWIGPVYPVGSKSEDMLRLYAAHFPLVELNFTYYAMPTAKTLDGMLRNGGPRLRFSIKSNRTMTHEIQNLESACSQFREGIKPIAEADRLACILHQFPASFRATSENEAVLLRLFSSLAGSPQVVEFRHRSWLKDDIYAMLRREKVGFCCVDEPRLPGLLPPISPLTSRIGYLRFHGRNEEKWYNHGPAWERYNYLYTEAELQEWIPTIRAMAQAGATVMILTNNHYLGQAFKNAQMIRELLRRNGAIVED